METSTKRSATSVGTPSGTKYRDIADGNRMNLVHQWNSTNKSGTKYRDIADGNTLGAKLGGFEEKSGTKYRDIADGNFWPRR